MTRDVLGRFEGKYGYIDVPFDEMEVGDCVSIPINKLIPDNPHPDTKEKNLALTCMSTHLSRKYPDKKFTYCTDKPVVDNRFKLREANLTRCVRIRRVK